MMNDKQIEEYIVEITRQAKKCSNIIKQHGSSSQEFRKEFQILENMKLVMNQLYKEHFNNEIN